ncbi:Heat shock factor binding protein 1 [Musa troglodytarum]|uniref:Heat shock factor binding protein 1 n=1 Tax=Musa troglodytarum TaxID=320322 RepID=A0A9E7K5W9_9LILI|nr:Heat shock factor binding protein 1 [Musa troglodytarum]
MKVGKEREEEEVGLLFPIIGEPQLVVDRNIAEYICIGFLGYIVSGIRHYNGRYIDNHIVRRRPLDSFPCPKASEEAQQRGNRRLRAMAATNPGGVKADQDSEYPAQSTADMTVFVQNLLVQMQNRFQAMSDSILSKIDDMGSKIDELEQSINELKAEMGVEGVANSKAEEDEPSEDAA